MIQDRQMQLRRGVAGILGRRPILVWRGAAGNGKSALSRKRQAAEERHHDFQGRLHVFQPNRLVRVVTDPAGAAEKQHGHRRQTGHDGGIVPGAADHAHGSVPGLTSRRRQ